MVASPSKNVSGLAAAEAHVGSIGKLVSGNQSSGEDEEEEHPQQQRSLGEESELGCVPPPARIHDPCFRSPFTLSRLCALFIIEEYQVWGVSMSECSCEQHFSAVPCTQLLGRFLSAHAPSGGVLFPGPRSSRCCESWAQTLNPKPQTLPTHTWAGPRSKN